MTQGDAARQWACQQALVRFFRFLDDKRYDEAAALFAPLGTWRRPGSVVEGRDDILASLRQRPPQRTTRHAVANFLVVTDGGAKVDASAMLMTFGVEGAKPHSKPALASSFAGLFSAKASFDCGAGAPLIAELELAPDVVFAR